MGIKSNFDFVDILIFYFVDILREAPMRTLVLFFEHPATYPAYG